MSTFKPFIVVVLFLTTLHQVKGQDILDSIAVKSCDCIGKLNLTDLSKEKLTIELGLCMMKAAQPYEKQLKSVHGIDMQKINKGDGEKLGRLVGLKLASNCENFTEVITKITSDEKTSHSIEGTITEFVSDQFITIILKDEDGRDQKIIWLDYFKNSEKLLQKGKNKNVTIDFEERDLYSPKFNDYIKYKVATGIRYDD